MARSLPKYLSQDERKCFFAVIPFPLDHATPLAEGERVGPTVPHAETLLRGVGSVKVSAAIR